MTGPAVIPHSHDQLVPHEPLVEDEATAFQHLDEVFNVGPRRGRLAGDKEPGVGTILQHPVDLEAQRAIDVLPLKIPLHSGAASAVANVGVQPRIWRIGHQGVHERRGELLDGLPRVPARNHACRAGRRVIGHIEAFPDPGEMLAQILIDPSPDGVLQLVREVGIEVLEMYRGTGMGL